MRSVPPRSGRDITIFNPFKNSLCQIYATNLNLKKIHFSDGGGRSGVYLAIDANMELGEEEDAFDVFGYLKKLRQSRKGLIENLVSKS